jgi:Zn finger protein HypA/HybF involved in hydrogenase expression
MEQTEELLRVCRYYDSWARRVLHENIPMPIDLTIRINKLGLRDKRCMECNQYYLHEADDYICLKCRRPND